MEQRILIKSHVKLGTSAAETHRILQKVFGKNCLSKSSIFQWYKEFNEGRETINNIHIPKPRKCRTPEMIQKVHNFLANDKYATTRMIANALGISRGTVAIILKEDLNKANSHLEKQVKDSTPTIDVLVEKQKADDVVKNPSQIKKKLFNRSEDKNISFGSNARLRKLKRPGNENKRNLAPRNIEEVMLQPEPFNYCDSTAEAIDRVIKTEIVDEADFEFKTELRVCYICDATSSHYSQSLYETKSLHSNTRITDFIKRWLNPRGRATNTTDHNSSDDNSVCINCLNKINEYDLLCVTAERINKELQDTFLITKSKNSMDQKCEQIHPSIENNVEYVGKLNSSDLLEEHQNSTAVVNASEKDIIVAECQHCPNKFSNEFEFIQHVEWHKQQENKFKCEKCGLDLKEGKSLLNHSELHQPLAEYQCVICKKISRSRKGLYFHMNSVHISLQCDRCGAKVFGKSMLTKHNIRFHTESIKCEFCNKAFKVEHHLKAHQKNKHG